MLKYLFLCFALFCSSLAWSHPNFNKIPLKDKEALEQFFKYLIHHSIIGYSLCGEKPVSLESFPSLSKIPPQHLIKLIQYPGYSMIKNGIDVWLQYSHLFPSKQFVFRFVPEYNTIVLINKQATLKVIEDNLDLFQKYSGSQQTAQQFLKEVCCPKNRDYTINYHRALLGILLGYGRNNSMAFYQKHYFQKLEGFKLYHSHTVLNQFMDPGFIIITNGTNEEENANIKHTLRIAKQNIGKYFEKGHYLESFVKLLTR